MDQRGAVFAEYAVVFILVTLIMAIAVAGLGVPLMDLYSFSYALIALPIP